MDTIFDTPGFFTDDIGLAWIGDDDPRAYDPRDEDPGLDDWDGLDGEDDLLVDDGDRVDFTGERFPFE